MEQSNPPDGSRPSGVDDGTSLGGCTTCLLGALAAVMDDPEDIVSNDGPKRLLAGTVPGAPDKGKPTRVSALWSKKSVLWIAFYAPQLTVMENTPDPANPQKTIKTPVTGVVNDFVELTKAMFEIMQRWTKGHKLNVRSGAGAALELRRFWYIGLTPSPGESRHPEQRKSPDILVEVRNREALGKKSTWYSEFGRSSAGVIAKSAPSITLDFGEYPVPGKGKIYTEPFFVNQVLHEFGHALGFLHEHFQSDFQNMFFKNKLSPT